MTNPQDRKMWPIRRLLVLPGTLVTLTLSTLFIAAISLYSYQNLRQDFDLQFSSTSRLFLESITNPLLLGQDEVVYRECNLLKAQSAVVFVRVMRPNGAMVCSIGDKNSMNSQWHQVTELKVLFDPEGKDIAANVLVVYSLAALRTQILSWFWFGIALAAVFCLCHGWLYLNLAERVAEPVAFISNLVADGNAERIDQGLIDRFTAISEIEVLNVSLRGMAQRLIRFQLDSMTRERDRIASELARQVAHDIRSPLSALKILSAKLKREGAESSALMTSAVERIEGMAENILVKSRTLSSVTSVSSLTSAVQVVCSEAAVKADVLGVRLEFEKLLLSGLVSVHLLDLQRILANIIQNALEVSRADDAVRVVLEDKGDKIEVSVSDQGPGLPTDLREKIGKEEVASSKVNGNGIGLYSAYQVVRSWGAEIRYADVAGGGSRFTIDLPKEHL